ncbi:MAG: TonB C-terminal domain-containing protein [Candidatus Aminicenantales bacterium]
MFEDCVQIRKGNGSNRSKKILPLALSLIFHIFLIYGLYHAQISIKILKLGPSVHNVVIGPALTSSLPKIVGSIGPGVPAKGPPPGGGPGPEGASGPPRRRAPSVESTPAAPAQPGREASGTPSSDIPALSSKFQKALASHLKTDQGAEFKIVLAPPGSKPGPAGPAAKGAVTDFFSYLPGPVGETGGGRYGTGRTGRGGRGTGSGQRASISIPLKGYDLTPWAQKVLELIVRNWDLPSVGNLPDRSEVRIILIISKSGDLSSLEMVEGTALDVLDRAAVKAIRASLPFPALPADFPGDFLEAHVEFSYHD